MTGQTTLGAGATPLISTTTPLRAMQLTVQNNTGAAMRVADSPLVSMTVPAAVLTGTAGFGILIPIAGSFTFGPFTSGAENLNKFYVAGTATIAVDWQYTPEE